ncbi:MAG: SPOR domain-containing protein [Flavobacteriales bacterium]|nr:SPOR domain-containing protein [Flavobacteriales bacterium]
MIKKLLKSVVLTLISFCAVAQSTDLKEPNQDFDIRDCKEALQIISGLGVTSVADFSDVNLNRNADGNFVYDIAEGSYSYWYQIVAQSDFELNFSIMPKVDSTMQFALYKVNSDKNFCESYLEEKYQPKRLVLYSDNAAQKGVGLTGEANVDYNDVENRDNIIRHTPYHKSLFIEGGEIHFLHVFKMNKNEVDHKLTIGDVSVEMNTNKPPRTLSDNTEKLRAFLTGTPLDEDSTAQNDTDDKPAVSIVNSEETKPEDKSVESEGYADAMIFEYDEEEYEDITVSDLNLPEKEKVDVEEAKAEAEKELNQLIAEGKEKPVEIKTPEAKMESQPKNENTNNTSNDTKSEVTDVNPVVENKSKPTNNADFSTPSVSNDIKTLEGFTSSAPIYGQVQYKDGTSPSNAKLVAVDLEGNSRPEYVLTNSSGVFEMYDVESFKRVVFGFSEYDSEIDKSKDPYVVGVVKDRTKIYGARMNNDDKNFEVRNIPFMDFGDRALTDVFGELSKVDFSNPEEYADALSKFGDKAIEGVVFKVQIGAFQNTRRFEKKLPNYASLGSVEKYEMGDGLTRFTIGNLDLLKQAESLKQKARSAGLNDAFIVSFKDGKRSLELR